MKEHIKANMINKLKDVAIQFHDHQMLRQLILSVVNEAEHEDIMWYLEHPEDKRNS